MKKLTWDAVRNQAVWLGYDRKDELIGKVQEAGDRTLGVVYYMASYRHMTFRAATLEEAQNRVDKAWRKDASRCRSSARTPGSRRRPRRPGQAASDR